MARNDKKTAKTERSMQKSTRLVDFRKDPTLVGVDNIAVFLNGVNRPKTLIGKIVKVFDRGIEVYAEGYYMAEWKNVIRIYEAKEARYKYDMTAAIDELAETDDDVKRAKTDMKRRPKSENDECFIIEKPEPEAQADDEEPAAEEPVASVSMRKTRSKSVTVLGRTFASKNDAHRWLRDEKKMSWKEVIATCKV